MKIALIVILAIAVLIGGVVFFSRGGEDSSPQNGGGESLVNKISNADKAPDFRLKDYDGNEVALADFAGQNIILNSWAVWCPFCVDELPDFADLQREFAGEITVISIDRAEPLEKQKRYTDDLGVTDDIVFLQDPDDSFYRSIGGFSMPETLFVDGEGNILLHKRGPMRLEEMRKRVNELF